MQRIADAFRSIAGSLKWISVFMLVIMLKCCTL